MLEPPDWRDYCRGLDWLVTARDHPGLGSSLLPSCSRVFKIRQMFATCSPEKKLVAPDLTFKLAFPEALGLT